MRRPDWRARLHAYIEAQRRVPFIFGQSDCLLFSLGAVEAMTGTDHAADVRGKYTTLQGGLKRLAAATGARGYVEYVAGLFDEVVPALAQIGDLAVVDSEEGPALGIVGGAYIFVPRDEGLGVVPLTEAKRAFRT